jgi:C-terminal processing protease CtpA/Prc
VIFRLLRNTEELQRLGIRPGLTVTQIDGRPVAELVEYWRALKTGSTRHATDRLAYFRILTGPRASQVSVVLEEPNGASRQVQLTRSERYFNDTNLDPPVMHVTRAMDGGIAYFQANQMRPEVGDAFARFIDGTADLKGLILDLRYNGGGSDQVSFDMVSRLIDRPLDGPIYEVTSYRTDRRAFRQPQEVIRTQPRVTVAAGRRFTGPLIVLIGAQTHSATESGFLAVIRQRPGTTLMGEPTAGSTGQPLAFALPGNALGVVCSLRSLTPDGRAFVGIGFAPDVSARLTREDLLLGRDSTIDAAVARLRAR